MLKNEKCAKFGELFQLVIKGEVCKLRNHEGFVLQVKEIHNV